MKKVLLFLFLSLGFFTASVKAETTNTVGIINVLEINDKAKVMKSLNAQRDKAVEEIQDEVNSKRKEFEKKEEELKGKQSLMEKEAFGKEVVSFQMDVMNYDKQTEQKLSKVEKSYIEALKTIQKDYLDRIVRDIGKSKGFEVVINAQTAIILNDNLDITEDVIEALDEEITEIDLSRY